MPAGQKRVSLGSDHAGFPLKDEIRSHLAKAGHEILDRGSESASKDVDYPDFAVKVVEDVLEGRADKGVLICGTGIGMSITANRFKGIRAALVHDVTTAEMAAKHNDANVLCMGARLVAPYLGKLIVDKWLDTPFEERHRCRLDAIEKLTQKGR